MLNSRHIETLKISNYKPGFLRLLHGSDTHKRSETRKHHICMCRSSLRCHSSHRANNLILIGNHIVHIAMHTTASHLHGFPVIWNHGKIIKAGLALLEFVQCSQIGVTSLYYAICFLTTTFSRLWLDCKVLTESRDNFEDQVKIYRKIGIFEKILNSCIRSRIFLTLALLGPAFQILTGFALIEVVNSPDLSILLACRVIYVGVVAVTLICFSVAGQVNQISGSWITGRRAICKSRADRQQLRSLVPLRIQFGTNYVEALTPLVVQEFCVQQTASLLILTR